MARNKFGGTSADIVLRDVGGLLGLAPTLTLTAWDSEVGGTRYTDLLDADGQPTANIRTVDSYVPVFYGPDGVTELWIDDGDQQRARMVAEGRRGPKGEPGDQGPPGPAGLPATNAAEDDQAIATFASTPGTATHDALTGAIEAGVSSYSAPLPSADVAALGRPLGLVRDLSQPSGWRWEVLAAGTLDPIAPSGEISWQTTVLSLAPHSIGIDGAVYGGLEANALATWRSSDPTLGTRESGYTFAGETGFAVTFVTRTSAGYVAVLLNSTTGVTRIWFSTSWTTGWSVVHTMGRVSASVSIGRPTLDADGVTVMTIGEYVTGSYPSNLMTLYVTADGGQTWAAIKQTVLVDDAINSHWHGSCYDPDRDRIWACNGDGVNSWFGYSDDWRASGTPTWVGVPMDPEDPLYDGIAYQQPTLVAYMGDRLALTPDRGNFPTGIWVANPDTGLTGDAFAMPTGESTHKQYGLMRHAYDAATGHAYVMFPDTAPSAGSDKTYIVGTGDGGRTWHLVSTIDTAVGSLSMGIVGPGPGGKLFAKGLMLETYSSGIMIGTPPTWSRG